MEQIVFPVPSICEFLTKESKLRVYYTTERDEQGSKINDFFLRSEDLFNEMNWQKKLRGKLVFLQRVIFPDSISQRTQNSSLHERQRTSVSYGNFFYCFQHNQMFCFQPFKCPQNCLA